MNTPKDRAELIELMCRPWHLALNNGQWPDWDKLPREQRQITADVMGEVLDVLEAYGCHVSPNEATEEMRGWTDINVALAAGPYRSKP